MFHGPLFWGRDVLEAGVAMKLGVRVIMGSGLTCRLGNNGAVGIDLGNALTDFIIL